MFGVALLMRGGFGVVRWSQGHDPSVLEFPDEQQYWLMAGSLHAGEGLRDELGFRATRMPLYPAALSLVAGVEHGMTMARVFQWLLGAITAVGTAALATDLFNRRVGWVAGLFAAFDPFLVFFSSLLLTETLFCACAVALWWTVAPMLQATRAHESIRRWAGIGLLAVLCVYTRESSLGLIAILLVFVLLCRRFDRRTVLGAALVGALVVGSLIPWALRNQRITGRWCWLTHRAGISLYDGVGPQADGSSRLGAIKQMPEVVGKSEAEWNRYFLEESIQRIRNDPGRVLRLAGTKLLRMWNPLPNVETYQSRTVRFISGAWMLPVFLLAIGGLVFCLVTRGAAGTRHMVFLLIPAGYLSVVHSLFVGSVRYRLPAMPMIEIIAALALCAMIERISRGRRTRTHGDRA